MSRRKADRVANSLNALLEQLSAEDRTRLQAFARQAREQLPERLEPEFRKEGVAFVQNIVANRPSGVSHADMQAYLRTQRETFNRVQIERWKKVGAIVEKQAGDWLRTASFALKLVQGASAKQTEIDAAIAGLSAGWNMERQVAVDRNILRIGGYEMLFMEERSHRRFHQRGRRTRQKVQHNRIRAFRQRRTRRARRSSRQQSLRENKPGNR